MKTVFEEYGQFIIALIVFIAVMAILNTVALSYKNYSRALIAGLTGVSYEQTDYTRW